MRNVFLRPFEADRDITHGFSTFEYFDLTARLLPAVVVSNAIFSTVVPFVLTALPVNRNLPLLPTVSLIVNA